MTLKIFYNENEAEETINFPGFEREEEYQVTDDCCTTYLKDKERLNNLLLTSKDIKNDIGEILDIIPELAICVDCTQNHPAHIYKVLDHILETVNKVESNLMLKLAALLHDIGKPYKKVVVDNTERFWGHEEVSEEIARHILNRLGYEEDLIIKLCTLIKYHDHKTVPTLKSVQDTINLVGDELIPYLFELQTADLLSHSEHYYKLLLPKLNVAKRIYNLSIDRLAKEEKRKNWQITINMNQLDGAWVPSEEFKELIEREINGEISTQEMVEILNKKYKKEYLSK
jgi:tRNA nucleotidyltransferase (CCA-adding enzyme)